MKKYLDINGLRTLWGKIVERLSMKVDIEDGKGLSAEDYTTAEKTKLAGLSNYDDSAVRASLANKVDKIQGKGLSTEDFTTAEKTKLAGLENTSVDSAFSSSSENPVQNKVVTAEINGINAQLTYMESHKASTTDLATKVDKVQGKGLSTEDFTTAEKEKLAELYNFDDDELWSYIDKSVPMQDITDNSADFNSFTLSSDDPSRKIFVCKTLKPIFNAPSGASAGDCFILQVDKIRDDGSYVSVKQTVTFYSLKKTFTRYYYNTVNDSVWSVWRELGANIPIDSTLSTSSENPVQNKVIASEINGINAQLTYMESHKASTTDLATKVDKVTGKGLSTEDFTTAEKAKLEELYNFDDDELWSYVERCSIGSVITDNSVDFNSFVLTNDDPIRRLYLCKTAKPLFNAPSGASVADCFVLQVDKIRDDDAYISVKQTVSFYNLKKTFTRYYDNTVNDSIWSEWRESGSGSSITVDNSLSSTSANPVQNKAVKAALDGKLSLRDVDSEVDPSSNYPVSGMAVYDELSTADNIPCPDMTNVEDFCDSTEIDLNDFHLYDITEYLEPEKAIRYYYSNGKNSYHLAYNTPFQNSMLGAPLYHGFILKVERFTKFTGNTMDTVNVQTLTINNVTYRRKGYNSSRSSNWGWYDWYIVPDKEVPPATVETLGVVKPGRGLGVEEDGTLFTYSQKHTISYILHGGEAVNPVFFDENDTFTLNEPTKTGYNFVGWVGSNGIVPDSPITIELGTTEENLHYEAVYEPIVYTVTFDDNGTTFDTQLIAYDSKAHEPDSDPSQTGYTFDGWYKNGVPYDFDTIITGDVTITAHYTPITYTITYDLDGGSASNRTTYTIETNSFTLSKPTKTAYVFGGWTGSNGNSPQTTVTIPKGSYGNKSYTANWGSYEDFCYGFKISKSDSSPASRVTYMGLNKNFAPATTTSSSSSYADWEDFFVIKGNYPVALNRDGTEAYKLDPNDHSKKLDGTSSGYNSSTFGGLFMAAFPKAYFYCYNDSNYNYVWICENKLDSNFKAWAHINSSGHEVDKFYVPMFGARYSNSKVVNYTASSVSLSLYTSDMSWSNCAAIGSGWQVWDKSMYDYIILILILLFRTTNLTNVLGYGSSSNSTNTTGSTYDKGRFKKGSPMKALFIENLWGGPKKTYGGYISYASKLYIKMSPPYNDEYTSPTNHTLFGNTPNSGYITSLSITNSSGIMPAATNNSGSSSTYECSYFGSGGGYSTREYSISQPTINGSTFTYYQNSGQPCYRAPG